MKVGKMRSSFGKVNTLHNHVLPWTDRPLVTENLLGGEEGISDAGISVSRLIPNPLAFLEATGEVFSRRLARSSRRPTRGDLTYVGQLRGYHDLTESTNLDLGGSFAYGHNVRAAPTATTRLFGVDVDPPLAAAAARDLQARSSAARELVWSRRDEPAAPRERAFGTYVSGDYQFARRWFAGARYDCSGRAADATSSDKGGSLLLTYWPSEFSQVRGQYRRTRLRRGHDGQRVPLPVPVLDRRARRASVLTEAQCDVTAALDSPTIVRARWRLARRGAAQLQASSPPPKISPRSPARSAATRSNVECARPRLPGSALRRGQAELHPQAPRAPTC